MGITVCEKNQFMCKQHKRFSNNCAMKKWRDDMALWWLWKFNKSIMREYQSKWRTEDEHTVNGASLITTSKVNWHRLSIQFSRVGE